MRNKWLFVLLLIVPLFSCGGGGPNLPPPTTGNTVVPAIAHVVVVVEENHPYSGVIGNASAPYLNSLATSYSLATQYFADTHPSIGNYFMLTTGELVTNDDTFSGTVAADNLARHLIAGGKTWKSYAESLPSVGYLGGDSGPYPEAPQPVRVSHRRHHRPGAGAEPRPVLAVLHRHRRQHAAELLLRHPEYQQRRARWHAGDRRRLAPDQPCPAVRQHSIPAERVAHHHL